MKRRISTLIQKQRIRIPQDLTEEKGELRSLVDEDPIDVDEEIPE